MSGVRHEPKRNGPRLGSVYAQGIGKGIGLDPFVRAELDRISEFTGRGESGQVARVALQSSRESSEVGRCRGTTGLFEPEPRGHGIFGDRRRTDRITYVSVEHARNLRTGHLDFLVVVQRTKVKEACLVSQNQTTVRTFGLKLALVCDSLASDLKSASRTIGADGVERSVVSADGNESA